MPLRAFTFFNLITAIDNRNGYKSLHADFFCLLIALHYFDKDNFLFFFYCFKVASTKWEVRL